MGGRVPEAKGVGKVIPLAFEMPLRTATGCNNREHHFARASRVKRERAMTAGHLVTQGYFRQHEIMRALPLRITLTRVSPRYLRDAHFADRSWPTQLCMAPGVYRPLVPPAQPSAQEAAP